MNCRDVRQRLLEIDLDHLGDLTPHLDRCPDCRALVDAIRTAQDDLDQRLEDFVTTASLDDQWAHALREVDGQSPRTSWLTAGVLTLAAAAVVVLALWPAPPPPDGHQAAPPPLLAELREQREVFDAVDLSPSFEGMERPEQDTLLRSRLDEKSSAYLEFEATAAALASDEAIAPRWRARALLELGWLYAAMGDALANSTPPTYLAENQREYYVARLRDKAAVQWTKALDHYRQAAELAATSKQPDVVARARRAAVEVRQRLPEDEAPEP